MGMFGWSYPAGCSSRDVDEAMGGNPALEALEEEIWERPELKRMSEKNKRSLTDWIAMKISEAERQGYHQACGDTAYAEALEAERVLAEHWKATDEQVEE